MPFKGMVSEIWFRHT